MEGKKVVLVDTDILIKIFRGHAAHKKQLDFLSGRIAVSLITVLELYQGATSKARKYGLEKQLRAYEILPVDERISSKAILLMKKYLPERQLLPPDSLIAATALQHQIKLYTDNKQDFNFIRGIKFY